MVFSSHGLFFILFPLILSGEILFMWKQLIIEDVRRLSRFPFRVKEVGYTHGGTYPEREIVYLEKLEICLRLYSQEAEAVEYINSVRHVVKYPHVVLKMPGVPHRFTVQVPRESVYFAYAPEMVASLREVLPFPEQVIWEICPGDLENRLISEMTDLMERSQEYGVADRIDLVAFQLMELLFFRQNYTAAHPDCNEAKIRSIASYFQLHFRENIDVLRLVARFGMSRSTFIRHWRRLFPQTPGQYILNLKLQTACRSLEENPNLPIQTLSRSLNFQDAAYFCALFKQHFGMTPRQYRMNRNKAARLQKDSA